MAGGGACGPYARRVSVPTPTDGKAGASARREGERRKAKREAAVHERYPRMGGVILALQDAPQHERSWGRGAGGEELVEEALQKHCPGVRVLHDRRIRGSRANIDHIAIAANGVWVIDSKRYKGKLQVAKPLFGKPTLKVAGRDHTKLVDGLVKQVDLVTAAVADIGLDVSVRGCFCFVDTELPLFGAPTINGLSIFGRRGLGSSSTCRVGSLPTAPGCWLTSSLSGFRWRRSTSVDRNPAHTVRNATAGGIRDARTAGIRPLRRLPRSGRPGPGWPAAGMCWSLLHPRIVGRVGIRGRATVIGGFAAQFVVPRLVGVDPAQRVRGAMLRQPRRGTGGPDVDRVPRHVSRRAGGGHPSAGFLF